MQGWGHPLFEWRRLSWAPNASRVFVSGTFNGWAPDATPLVNEQNGFWSTDVPGAKPGDGYKFRILNGGQELWRIDPYARQVTNSVGEAVVLTRPLTGATTISARRPGMP